MDATPITLDPGKIILGVEIQNTGPEGYFIGVSSSKAPRVWFYRRELTDPNPKIPLPVHPKNVILWVSPGKVVSTWQKDLIPHPIPYPKNMKRRRPYNLSDMQFIPRVDINTPARVYKREPVTEINPVLWREYPEPTQKFILAHEQGHHYFDKEEDADAFAIVTLLRKGYGMSQIQRALTRVLGRTESNVDRMVKTHRFLDKVNSFYYG